MKIINFSTFDIQGGAGSAAYQLHNTFKENGLESIMLVKYKKSNDDSVIMIGGKFWQNKLFQQMKRNFITYFIFSKFLLIAKKIHQENLLEIINNDKPSVSFEQIVPHLKNADIICLHWIDNFLSTELIKKIKKFTNKPIIWVMQDLEPITGGCHYPGNCKKFMTKCDNCPIYKADKKNDRPARIWQQKKENLSSLGITFIAPSVWVAEKIKQCSLFKHNNIANILLSVDKNIFHSVDKSSTRKKLNLPADKKIIFFGAQNFNEQRKGFSLLSQAFNSLKEKIAKNNPDSLSSILLISAGHDMESLKHYFNHLHLGWIKNPSQLAAIYQSADVFVCPSIEDAGPVMINQAVACQTPVVSFDIGVARNLITSPNRGYITPNFNSQLFCDNIYKILFANIKPSPNDVTDCHPKIIYQKYLALFNNLLKS